MVLVLVVFRAQRLPPRCIADDASLTTMMVVFVLNLLLLLLLLVSVVLDFVDGTGAGGVQGAAPPPQMHR